MNRYTVVWWEEADAELLRLWLDSPHRPEITAASREIDRMLATNAEAAGEEVSEGLYALEVAPLRVQFDVVQEDCVVRVWTVRLVTP